MTWKKEVGKAADERKTKWEDVKAPAKNRRKWKEMWFKLKHRQRKVQVSIVIFALK